MNVKAIILATDQRANMKSNKAKALHEILGKPLITYSAQAVQGIGVKGIGLIAEKQSEEIKNVLGHSMTRVFEQGTDTKEIIKFIGQSENIIILNGDTPLITTHDLKKALETHEEADSEITKLSVHLDEQGEYGNVYILKSALLEQAMLKEASLENVIKGLSKGEYNVSGVVIADESHLLKVDSRSQLAKCTRIMKHQINQRHMENGVTIEDPWNTYIGPEVTIGFDTVIEPGCILRGTTTIGSECIIGCHSNIEDSQIANHVRIENSVIYESFVDDHTHVGPFAYIRPQSKIGKHVRIGDFVEIKNATIGDHTKISHLTYVGDADVGEHVNFGCGTVLVNFDGINKHRSLIEDHAFIGCNTNLVSPVTIGEGAYTAAGSTITKDVPKESLGISRGRQVNKEGWVAYKYPKE